MQRPWLREGPEVLGLGVMVCSSNEAMSEQIGNFLGGRPVSIEPRGKGMAQTMRAIPTDKTASAIGSIHRGSYRPGGKWTPPQKCLPNEQLHGIGMRSMPQIVAKGAGNMCRQW